MAGASLRYQRSDLTGDGRWQGLARGFQIGMRFHWAPVLRMADGKALHLGLVKKTDARWLLCAVVANSQIAQLKTFCNPIDPDETPDTRAALHADHHACDITAMPDRLFPKKGPFGLRD